jgi:hypothetical protein
MSVDWMPVRRTSRVLARTTAAADARASKWLRVDNGRALGRQIRAFERSAELRQIARLRAGLYTYRRPVACFSSSAETIGCDSQRFWSDATRRAAARYLLTACLPTTVTRQYRSLSLQ